GRAISLLAAARRPLSQSVTTGTLSMSSGSLFYSLFTSFHSFDDYLPILHYRMDMEFYSSTSQRTCFWRLRSRLLATRQARLFRCCARSISVDLRLTI